MVKYLQWEDFVEEELEMKFWKLIHNGAICHLKV
jgi:hypothetical protein